MTPSPPDEREAIVRWLRDNKFSADSDLKLDRTISTFWSILINKGIKGRVIVSFESLADAIERGHHLSEQGEGYE